MAKDKLPKQSEDFPAWYNQVVRQAGMAENGLVKGTMIIKPHGFAIWESVQRALDDRFKATGHENVYFPLLFPMKLFEAEAEHVEGFAPEVAVVTHGGGQKLEEPLAIRPDVRGRHLGHVLALGAELSRSPAPLQPVVQRAALGDADAPVPPDLRVPVAGRAHRARDQGGSVGRDPSDGRGLPPGGRGRLRDPGASSVASPSPSGSPARTRPSRSRA